MNGRLEAVGIRGVRRRSEVDGGAQRKQRGVRWSRGKDEHDERREVVSGEVVREKERESEMGYQD